MDVVPPRTPWDRFGDADQPPAGEYVELPESGWGALIAWLAGPELVTRVADNQVHLTVHTSLGSGRAVRRTQRRSSAENDVLNDDIDHYLREADGAPSRPRGYRWFLQLPHGLSEEAFWAIMNSAGADSVGPVLPSDAAQHVRQALGQI